MPCRQTYEVNKRELNKAAQRDQSYRNCLVALLIFFFLCLILILVCIPWKASSRGGYNDEYDKHKYHSSGRINERPTTTTKSTKRIYDVSIDSSSVSIKSSSVGIESSSVSPKEDNEPESHEDNTNEKIQDETMMVTESIYSIDDEDYFMTKSPKDDNEKTQKKTMAFIESTFKEDDKNSTENSGYSNPKEETTTADKDISIIQQITDVETTSTSPSGSVATDKSPFDEYHSSEKLEINITTHNIVTSTSSTESINLVKNETTNPTDKYMTSHIKSVTRNITTTTLSTSFIQTATTDKYSTDEYPSSKASESDTSTDNTVTSTSTTRSTDLTKNATTNPTIVIWESKNVTRNVTTSTLSTPFTQPSTTDKYSSDEYFSSVTSEFDTLTDNITTSPSLMGDETTFSTSEYIMLETNVTIDDVTSSTLPTRLDDLEGNSISTHEISITDTASTMNPSTDSEEDTSAGYSSDDYSQKSQSVVSIIYGTVKTTIPTTTLLESEEEEHTEYSTTKQEEESTSTGYEETLNNNDVTRGSFFVTENYQSSSFPTTTEIINDLEDITDVTMSTRSQNNVTETYNQSVTPVTTEQSFTPYVSTTPRIISSSVSPTNTTTITPLLEEEEDICKTEHCKRIASKMLSYMNHLADPCDDFYEYACGGFEASSQLIDGDLARQTKNYQRIAKQMAKEKRNNMHSTFATYYDSCVQYERTVNFNERVNMAIDALKGVGKFYTNITWSNNYTDFTNLFIQLILHHSALLFDVMPKFDEYRLTNYTLQIRPLKYDSPFMTGHADDLCLEDEFEAKQQYVNLEALYANYKKCNKNTEEFLRSIKEALTVFNIFKDLNDNDLVWDLQSQYIKKTVHDIDSIIIQRYFSHFPSKDKMQEVYAMNTNDKISLERLQSKSKLINWTKLIRSLIGADAMEANSIHNNNLHIYLYKELMNGLFEIEKFAENDPMSLNNAIMALYAHKLYRELVLPRYNNVKDHCLQVATNLLQLEASNLYILSFSDQEIKKMNELIQNSFNELKQTLRRKTEQVEWTDENGRNNLLEKVNNLKLSLPDLSYYKDRDLLYNDHMSQIVLHNYFNNSIILLKRYRTLMYAVLRKQTNQKKQIWMHYATPFQSKAEMIYSLNVVAIPYGIMDWSLIKEEHTLKYILLATLGNLIAHQIAHHFDNNGLNFWESSKTIIYEDDVTDMNLDDYINCHKDNLYQAPMNFTLPFNDQTVSLTIPRLTLNERLSDIVGLRLAYDTLALTKSKAEKQLPWIQLSIEKLFYLAYAQMYCTKSPLTSSYVSLYESEDLPNRIRMFVSTSNNKFVAEEWNCPVGSQIAPSDVCSVFPYIDYKETTQVLA